MNARAVFLDRDGVINRAMVRAGKPYPPAGIGELEILPGVADALARLKSLGFLLIVVTNQPDVARGTATRDDVTAIHRSLGEALPIDDFRTCFHDSGEGCGCRKPRPGMLVDAATQWDVDLSRSYMVGDRWRDVGAAHAAGCRPLFIDYGYDERRPDEPYECVASLPEAADIITRWEGTPWTESNA